MLLNPGTVLSGRYEIIEKIGSGGMAVVYRGKDRKLDRFVTVKVLREEFVGDADFIQRFRSEACSAARLSHPNIVRAYDVGDDGDINYIVMEYIHGDTLKKAIKEKAPFDSRSTINVAIQIASALTQAHKSHIVHRDIKPQNILVGTDGVVKVTDFGIARAATVSTMTTTANAAGSVHYFSPEQARGGYVDEKSDIYSLGITMFEMITGVLPFQGNNSVSIALMHINNELPDIRKYNPNCTRSLEGIIKKATMKKADERYANIELLLADLIRARADMASGAYPRKESDAKRVQAAGNVVNSTSSAMGDLTATSEGMRMSRRAEAAAQLKAAQEKAAAEKAAQAQVETPQTTKPADPKELEYIRSRSVSTLQKEKLPPAGAPKPIPPEKIERSLYPKKAQYGAPFSEKSMEKADTPRQSEALANFEKYSRNLQISKQDEYEKEVMAKESVKASKRPDSKRKNPRLEEDFDNEHDRRTERKVVIAAVITALILIVAISAAGLKFMRSGIGGGEKDIEMPMFIGQTYDDAVRTAEALGITLVEDGEDYSSYYDAGYIFYQSVSEGTMIAENTKIGVKVSLGLTSEKMPDVVGKEEQAAVESIIKLVGDTVQVVYEFNDEFEVGKVFEQSPLKGGEITANSDIILKVSKGAENDEVAVPDVTNTTEAEARRSLEAVGLKVGSVSYTTSDRVDEGKVITQTIRANNSVAKGSVVNLVISNGKPETKPEQTTPTPAPVTPAPEPVTPAPEPVTPEVQAPAQTSSTKYFTVNPPAAESGSVYVRVVKNDADGAFPVVDEYREVSEFPYSISVTGTGSGTVTCYIDDVQQWSQNVNFSE
mgnify:CR=1 FL=1